MTVALLVDAKGDNDGFYAYHHRFHTADFPTSDNAKPRVDQLLGVNDHGVAAGFYTDPHGMNHAYLYTTSNHRFRSVAVPGDTNVTLTAINNLNDLAGFATGSGGATEASLKANGRTFHLAFPGASSTQALGVNNGDEVVGDDTVGSGSNAPTHGFIWAPGLWFASVDAPSGVGATTINGINNHGDLVGFYVDLTGNTHGFLAMPTS